MMHRFSTSDLLVAACFLASGFAALIYQTVWAREFAFAFGTTEIAVATVLAGYMAGLAAGSAAVGRFGGRIRRPILAYAILELGIALSALAVPWAIKGTEALLVSLYGNQPQIPEVLPPSVSIFYLVASFLTLMVPTSLMGATLPLLVRQVVRRDDQVGPVVSGLYALNTFGAVGGTLIAAFVLLPSLGLRLTVFVAVAVNGLVFVLAAAASRVSPPVDVDVDARGSHAARWSWILPVMTASGSVSFAYEVLWTRLLAHKLGGSVYAFATMLAAFLLGIALGSTLAGRWARTRESATQVFAWAQCGIALASWGAFRFADRLPSIDTGVGATPEAALLCAAVLMPASLAMGCTFPLAVRIVAGDESEASRASARVYAWNTVGSIIGALGAAYVLLPSLGFAGTVLACILVSLTLGAAVAGRQHPRALLACALVLVTALVLRPQEPLRLIATTAFEKALAADSRRAPVAWMAVGRSATVVLSREDEGRWRVWTNGLPESVINEEPVGGFRTPTVHWLGSLPALVRPGTKTIAAVGLGGGTHLELIPRTVERIDVIELEREVIVANRHLSKHRRRDPLRDPRVHVAENDARNAFVLSGRKWGGIIAQASHPWTAGAAHLYSREFFELSRSRLEEGGVFVQWMGPTFVDEALLQSIISTVGDVWLHVRVYQPPGGGGFLFVASDQPFEESGRAIATLRAADPETMDALGLQTRAQLDAGLLLDEEAAREFSKNAQVITDDRNLLQMRSPEVFQTGSHLLAHPPSLEDHISGMPAEDLERTLEVLAQHGNSVRMLAAIGDRDVDANLFRGLANLWGPKPLAGVRDLLESLSESPRRPSTRAALHTWVQETGVAPTHDAWRHLGDSMIQTPRERLILEAFAAERSADWETLAALESGLAEIPPDDAYFRPAVLLRGRWRVERGDPGSVREAQDILAGLLWSRRHPNRARLLYARAAWALGEKRPTAAALEALLRDGRIAPLKRKDRPQIDRLTEAVAADPELQDWKPILAKARRAARWVGTGAGS